MHIRHLRLYTHQLEAQHHFYTRTLELPQISRSSTAFIVRVGNSSLEFVASFEATHYHFAFSLPSNALEGAKSWLEGRTPLLRGGAPDVQDEVVFESQTWQAHMVYYRDPAGNIGEFIAHTGQTAAPTLEPTLEFGPLSLLGISEIGVVANDVLERVQTLGERFGLEPYRQDALPGFTAVGSQTGLFIVVEKGRLWFPDLEQAALPSRFEVQMVLESGQSVWVNERLERL